MRSRDPFVNLQPRRRFLLLHLEMVVENWIGVFSHCERARAEGHLLSRLKKTEKTLIFLSEKETCIVLTSQ